MLISEKDELYTFYELSYVRNLLIADDGKSENYEILSSKLEILQKKLNPNQNNMAIFFMPEQTFNVFSMLQGINCDVEITEKDLEKMISVVLKSEESSLKNHILKKLKVLLEFIENGNKVFPFPTPTDNLIISFCREK